MSRGRAGGRRTGPDAREAVVPGRARPARALPDRRRRGQVGRRPVVPAGAGQAAGHRGGVRLRQERDQPVDHGAAQGGRGEDLAARSGWATPSSSSADPETVRKLRGKTMAMIFQDPLSAMHPYYTVGAQIVEAYRLHHDVGKKAARKRAVELLDRVGIPQPTEPVRRLPAPVLRRHAAAGDDRDGAVVQPGPADRRRADHRAGRHRAGADPRPDPSTCRRSSTPRSSSSPTTSAWSPSWPTTSS